MSSQLNGHSTAMGSTQRDRKLLTVVALTAVLVAVLSIAGLKAAVSSPSAAPALVSSPLAAEPAAAPAPPAAPAAPAVAPAKTVAAPSKAATKSVMIMGYTYSPASLTVNVGDTVTWTNMDSAPHTVTVTDGPVKFDSGTMQRGDTYSYTFKEAGTYQYYCAVHPDMKASITVVGSEPDPTEEPTEAPTEGPAPSEEPTPVPDACEGLAAAVDTFMVHFNAAHLETSLGQQIMEALSLDQYALTHTILIKNMLAPLLGGVTGAADTFMQHVYAAHLETSPGQQIEDAIQIDKYALAHTSMIGNMLRPLLGSDLSSC